MEPLKWPVLQAVKAKLHLAPARAGGGWRESFCEGKKLLIAKALGDCVLS